PARMLGSSTWSVLLRLGLGSCGEACNECVDDLLGGGPGACLTDSSGDGLGVDLLEHVERGVTEQAASPPRVAEVVVQGRAPDERDGGSPHCGGRGIDLRCQCVDLRLEISDCAHVCLQCGA